MSVLHELRIRFKVLGELNEEGIFQPKDWRWCVLAETLSTWINFEGPKTSIGATKT